jgi:iron complex transport system substrate-binding protein
MILFLFGCADERTPRTTKGKSHVEFAKYFDIKTNNRDTVLTITDPDSETQERFLLTSLSSKRLKDTRTILVGQQRIIATSSTFIGMMSKLNMEDEIVGVLNKAYLANKKLISGIAAGEVIEIGSTEIIPLEKIIKSKANILFYSGFGNKLNNETQLEKIGVECIPVYDWKEKNPLGKAEWILLYGFISGKEQVAKQYIRGLKARYDQLKQSTFTKKPNILGGNVYGDVWNTPNGESYIARMINDAGGNYLFKHSKGTGSLLLDLEEVVLRSDSADVWIHPGYPTYSSLLNVNPKAKYLKPFKEERIYCYSHAMNRFWELSAIEPDKMIKDQLIIFHGGNEDSLYFYRKVINDLE